MVELEKSRRLFKWMTIAMGCFAILSILAIVGLTWAVVVLTKDTQVDDGVLVQRGSSAPVSLGSYVLPVRYTNESLNPPSRRRLMATAADFEDGSYVNSAGIQICRSTVGEMQEADVIHVSKRAYAWGDIHFTLQLHDRSCRVPGGSTAVDSTGEKALITASNPGSSCPINVITLEVKTYYPFSPNTYYLEFCPSAPPDTDPIKILRTTYRYVKEVMEFRDTDPANPGHVYRIVGSFACKWNSGATQPPTAIVESLVLKEEVPCGGGTEGASGGGGT